MKSGIGKREVMMKGAAKILRFAAAVLAAAISFSCTDVQDTGGVLGRGQMSLIASQETPTGTKTSIQPDRSVIWDIEEEIMVFGNGTSAKFTSYNAQPSASAEFHGSDAVKSDGGELWAIYPYDESATFDGSSITTVVRNEQTAKAGTFARNTNLSIANSASSLLQFYNVGGGVRFTVNEEGITKVIFEGLDGEAIAGTVKVGFGADGKPEVKEVTDGRMFITLNAPEGESLIPGEWYYIVAIPGTLEKGFKMRFYKGESYGRRVSEKQVTLKRSVYGTLEKADSDLEYPVLDAPFPETMEELLEAGKRMDEWAPNASTIIDMIREANPGEEDDTETMVTEIRKIDGVKDAYVTESGNIVVHAVSDIYTNIILNYNDRDERIELLPEETESVLTSISPQASPSFVMPTGKNALMLVPVYSETIKEVGKGDAHNEAIVRWYYDSKERYLTNAGFEVTKIYDEAATLDMFRGDFLDDFDVIYVNTHGLHDVVTHGGDLTTGFHTSTSAADSYFGNIGETSLDPDSYRDLSSCMVKIPDSKKDGTNRTYYSYLYMTSKTMERDNPKFDNTWFLAHACNSSTTNAMSSVILSHGAAGYNGFTIKADMIASHYVASEMIHSFCSGMEFSEATERARLYTTSNGLTYEGNTFEENKKGFAGQKRNSNDAFYIVKPQIASVSLSRNSITFQDTPIGTASTETFTVTNTGSSSLTVSSISLKSGAMFSVDNANGFTLSGGDSRTVTVTFKPTAEACFSDEITINTSSGYASSVTVSGNGVSAISDYDISFSSTHFYFGSCFIGKSITEDLVIKNNSKGDLVISGVDTPAGFRCGGTFPLTIPSGQSRSLKIGFSPVESGYRNVNIVFHMNTEPNKDRYISVEGTGVSKGSVGNPVDLGLPSGLKWASWNIGASSATETGAEFRWGDTNATSGYDRDRELYSGNPSVLPFNNDAARVNWGGSWRMPTRAEADELFIYCKVTYVKISGGGIFKVTGPNGNYVYFPARYPSAESTAEVYWTSSLMPSSDPDYGDIFAANEAAYNFVVCWESSSDDWNGGWTVANRRDHTLLIRPVMD